MTSPNPHNQSDAEAMVEQLMLQLRQVFGGFETHRLFGVALIRLGVLHEWAHGPDIARTCAKTLRGIADGIDAQLTKDQRR